MKLLSEKIVNTYDYAGTVDLISGIDDFESEVEFNDEWHTYKKEDSYLPSVTQIIDCGFAYEGVSKEVLDYAKFKGSLVHKEIEEWIKTGKRGFTSECEEFIRLFNAQKFLFEQKAVWDIKTYSQVNKANKEKTARQLEKYIEGIKYLTGEEINRKYMIWLPHNKNGKIIEL